MSLLILYMQTLFFLPDVVMLKRVLHPLFPKQWPHDARRAENGRSGVFYLLLAGIVFFVALPAANGESMFKHLSQAWY